jgi:IclR family acetate operon transcriptional repressor
MSSVQTALRVLEAVSERQPAGVSDIARQLDIPKTSAQRALTALRTAGWIRPASEQQPTRWVLTPRALIVGSRAGGDMRLTALVRPLMERLHVDTRETIHLLVRESDDMVIVEHLESPHVVRSSYPLGTRVPMCATSSGKALLAELPPDQAEPVLARGLAAVTDLTITDPEKMRAELEQTRRRGYATNRGELDQDIRAVAAAILDAAGRPVASISISVPAQRMPGELWDRYGTMVAGAARLASEALGHDAARASGWAAGSAGARDG